MKKCEPVGRDGWGLRRRRHWSPMIGALLLIVAIGAFSREARAETSLAAEPHARLDAFGSSAPKEDKATAPYWYGYEIVISDFFGASLLAAGLASVRACSLGRHCDGSMSAISIVSGATLYGFGGPAIHAGRSHWGKAGGSLALRMAPVVAASAIDRSIDTQWVAPLLLLGGMASAMVVDSVLLGYEEVAADSPQLTMAPTYDPKSRSGALVFATTF